jgi:hypothetical protein
MSDTNTQRIELEKVVALDKPHSFSLFVAVTGIIALTLLS